MEVDIAVMSPMSNSVISFIDVLCSFFVQINAIEKRMHKVLQPVSTVESAHPYVYEVKDSVTITSKGAESFQVVQSLNSKFPPMEFLRAIKFINPHNGAELMRITDSGAIAPTTILQVKDELRVEFEYNDLKK